MDVVWPKEGRQRGIGRVLRVQEGNVIWMGAQAVPRMRIVLETKAEPYGF